MSTKPYNQRISPTAVILLTLGVLATACDGDEGNRQVGFTKILKKDNPVEENVGNVPIVAATKELINCSEAERVGDFAGVISEASGFAHWKSKGALSLTGNSPEIGLVTQSDAAFVNAAPVTGIHMSTDGWKTVVPVTVSGLDQLADVEAIAMADCALGMCTYLLDGGANRLTRAGTSVQKSLVVYNGSTVATSRKLTQAAKIYLKFPDATDQFGKVHQGVDSFDWTAMAVNEKDGAIYMINKAVRGFGGDQENIDPVLIYKINKDVWSDLGNNGKEIAPTFVARLPIEYMVALDVRREGEKAINDLISILPSNGMKAAANRLLRTDDLTKVKPGDVDQYDDVNDTGKSLYELWAELWGDPAEASKNPALRILVTDMQFDPSGELFYVQTYNGPMLIDIDLTKGFPPLGEILTFKRHRHVVEAVPLLQMEALSVTVGEETTTATGSKSRSVTMYYTTEQEIQSIDGAPAYTSPDVPVMKFTCDQPL